MDLTVKAKRALEGMTEKEQEKALEILKAINGIEISRADKILTFCKEVARNTAVADTEKLFFS